jgi:hypothetical protein
MRDVAGRVRAELVETDGAWEVQVDPEREPYQAVVDLLNRVERWLDTCDVPATTIVLDGNRYTMQRGGTVAASRANPIALA